MSPKAFVYTELQISVPFAEAPWREVNPGLLEQPGLLNKTWLAGATNDSLGGFYTFDSLESAREFVTGYFPGEAAKFGVGQTTAVFDAEALEEASQDMNSAHFGAEVSGRPGAFVYTELQVNLPAADVPWREVNPKLKAAPGFLSKTWLSGVDTNTIGGLYAFDNLDHARDFALSAFPAEASSFNAAFYTRVFDASGVVEASRQMHSPFFA